MRRREIDDDDFKEHAMSHLYRHAMSACAALMTSLLLVASALPPL